VAKQLANDDVPRLRRGQIGQAAWARRYLAEEIDDLDGGGHIPQLHLVQAQMGGAPDHPDWTDRRHRHPPLGGTYPSRRKALVRDLEIPQPWAAQGYAIHSRAGSRITRGDQEENRQDCESSRDASHQHPSFPAE